MGDSLELPPSTGSFTPTTPSGLTPNTRSEAEAALSHNTIAQTDSAAPTTPLPSKENLQMADEGSMTEAQRAWRRPAEMIRTSSTNYEQALREARQESTSSVASTDGISEMSNITGRTVASPTSTTPFPLPGQGVVPLHTGVGSGQAEAIKRTKPSGMSLGALGRQQSWNAQDFKHVYSSSLMSEVKDNQGYASGTEDKK